ncbi:MAG TPA: serine/threonine-protein kinase [Polyangiaceae bacterium]|nr:serine/threonine-protein kinase [Polyangiaceae bacterium]
MADLIDGKYRLLRTVGEGAWGVVFEAENVRTFKRVALKVLRPRADVSADVNVRFEREAQAAGRIGSEHIVEVFDVGTVADGTQYMVMELLSGEDLARRIQRSGRLHPRVAAKIGVQVLAGLGAAHRSGILHRDLKPENLFLVPTRSGDDFVKILDFGISKYNDPSAASATMTGAVLGSPLYMSPEQARGLKTVDARTDLYSVGALLFEAVTGRPPFNGENFNDLMFKIVLSPRPNPIEARPDLDPHFATILVKSIAVEPNERYGSASEFRSALLHWLETQGVSSFQAPELRAIPPPARDANVEAQMSALLSSRRSPMRWSARNQDNVRATPISSSSPLESAPAPRRVVAIAVGATAVVLVAAAGVELTRIFGSERARAAAQAEPPPVTSANVSGPASAAVPAMPVQLVPLGSTTSSETPAAAPPPAAAAAAATASLASAAPVASGAPAASASPVASSAPLAHASAFEVPPRAPLPQPLTPLPLAPPRATVNSGPPIVAAFPSASAPPSTPAPSATAPIGTVEGREFRTGL